MIKNFKYTHCLDKRGKCMSFKIFSQGFKSEDNKRKVFIK